MENENYKDNVNDKQTIINEKQKIVVIRPGIGADKLEYIKQNFADSTELLLTDPVDIEEFAPLFVESVEILKAYINKNGINTLIAGSRGGKYIAALIKKDLWHGATVLISAMSTCEICQPGIPIVILHGTLDGTNIFLF